MTSKSIFEFSDYKVFLKATEESRKSYEKGFRSRLADQIGCKSGYISHVLNGDANLSLEQTLRAARFLSLQPKERKYFLLLVELSRAGTAELKNHFQEELSLLKDDYLNIKSHVGNSRALSESDQAIYYSSWHYLAIHVLISLQGFHESKSISQALRIPEEVTGRALLFLLQAQIITESGGRLKSGLTQVHLNRESPLIRQHHTNWRMAAVQSLMNANKTDIHYSTVSSLSAADADKLRIDMTQLIEHYVSTIEPSKEEVIYGFNLDFFNLLGN